MALHKLVRRNYGGKSPVSIRYQNLHSFEEGMILLCQSILETRQAWHLNGSALFTIPLNHIFVRQTFFLNLHTNLHLIGYRQSEQSRVKVFFACLSVIRTHRIASDFKSWLYHIYMACKKTNQLISNANEFISFFHGGLTQLIYFIALFPTS